MLKMQEIKCFSFQIEILGENSEVNCWNIAWNDQFLREFYVYQGLSCQG